MRGWTKARLERAAGLILLGWAALLILAAVLQVLQINTSGDAWRGGGEAEALSGFGVVFGGALGLLFLSAAVGVLRGATWGRRLGVVLSGLSGAWGSLALFSLVGFVSAIGLLALLGPVVLSWVAFVALVRSRNVPPASRGGPSIAVDPGSPASTSDGRREPCRQG